MNAQSLDRNLDRKLFQLMQEIARTIVVTDDINRVANFLLDVAINYTSAEAGSLMLANEHDELHILTARGLPSQFIKTYRANVGDGIAGMVAKKRRPVLVHDIERDQEVRQAKREHYKTKSFISCPIISKRRLLGVINLNDKKDLTPFTPEEFELVQFIADHAAIALENASLITQLKASAIELAEINKKMVETDLLKTEFLTRISHELRTPLNSLKGAIYYLQQQRDTVDERSHREFQNIIASETEKLTMIVENLLSYLRVEDESRIMNRTAMSLADVLKDVTEAAPLKTLLKNNAIQVQVRTDAAVSDVVGDRIKVIQLFTNLIEGLSHHLTHGDTITISLREQDFVTVDVLLPRELPKSVIPYLRISKHVPPAAHAEDQLKLYLARHIADTHQWDVTIVNHEGSCAVSLSIPKNAREKIDAYVNKSLDQFAEVLTDVLDLDICSIMLSDELTGELMVKSSRGLDENVVKRTRIKFGDKIAGWVALEGKPLLIEDIEDDPRFAKKNIPQYYTKSLMSLPLKIDGRVVGVINLNNKKTSSPFTSDDLQVATALSEKISSFLKQISHGIYQDQDFRRFLTTVNDQLRTEKTQADRKPAGTKHPRSRSH
jgi:hypothetical protein